MNDTYRHKGLRKKLIQSIIAKGIQDKRVIDALSILPRHYFMDKAFEEKAYEDKAFPIGSEQTISQPYTVAYQTELLEVKKRDKILEIGTGSGYQAAILALLGARVYTVERHLALHFRATKLLKSLGLEGIRTYHKDGYKGIPEFAPFDKILVTAAAEKIPPDLLYQLKPGGVLVVPVGKEVQYMKRLTKKSDGRFKEEILDRFKFVPFIKGLS